VKILSQLKINIMNKVQKILFAIVLATLFTSCQPGTDARQILSNADTRKDIMNTITNDSNMHQEMMTAMMNGKNGMMTADHASMMKMMKDNPGMLNGLMDMSKMDTAMCKIMMGKTMEMCDMDKSKCSMMMGAMHDHPKGMKTMKDMGMCDKKGMDMSKMK
jgi:hypothetical protein